jgi:hypothetical protein
VEGGGLGRGVKWEDWKGGLSGRYQGKHNWGDDDMEDWKVEHSRMEC